MKQFINRFFERIANRQILEGKDILVTVPQKMIVALRTKKGPESLVTAARAREVMKENPGVFTLHIVNPQPK